MALRHGLNKRYVYIGSSTKDSLHTLLFGTKSLLRVRPYNIQNFNNNIKVKPYTKQRVFLALSWLENYRQNIAS